MLNHAINQTKEYIELMTKEKRKKFGQFFTSMQTAAFMSSLYDIPEGMNEISILDAGAGSGILSCAFLERLENIQTVHVINLTCYENNQDVLELLRENLQYCQEHSNKIINFNICNENYITNQSKDFQSDNENAQKYDYIIGNPPYKKIAKDAIEALSMPSVCYGAPNLYFLFAAMSLFNLKTNGEMVYIIPRSWTSGAYFKKFREYFLTKGKLRNIHLFVSRNKVFEAEDVLQETIIIKVEKTVNEKETIRITSTASNQDFDNITELYVPYNLVVAGNDMYVYLVTKQEEVDILNKIHRFHETLPQIGLKMKTGLTVDFRNRDALRNKDEKTAVPLFYAQHIKKGRIHFPIQKDNEYIVTEKNGLLQENKNYLFVKRFTSKEESRRLQCGIYLSKDYSQYLKISTQNKINFIENLLGDMSECLVYGLYVIFNSTIYDNYYRILNGSTQVNSTEINSMPIPSLEEIKKMGTELLKSQDLSEHNCNLILEEYCE